MQNLKIFLLIIMLFVVYAFAVFNGRDAKLPLNTSDASLIHSSITDTPENRRQIQATHTAQLADSDDLVTNDEL